MVDGMRATSKWAALYFILLMTIGNYILFNLLVAILVEGFANQPVRKQISDSSGGGGGKRNKREEGGEIQNILARLDEFANELCLGKEGRR